MPNFKYLKKQTAMKWIPFPNQGYWNIDSNYLCQVLVDLSSLLGTLKVKHWMRSDLFWNMFWLIWKPILTYLEGCFHLFRNLFCLYRGKLILNCLQGCVDWLHCGQERSSFRFLNLDYSPCWCVWEENIFQALSKTFWCLFDFR